MITETLCKEKERCINEIEGKFLVLAGPGAGKTFIIKKRVENIIKQGYDAQRILCLTYTAAGALHMENEIRKEIEKSCGSQNINLNIYTFHSSALAPFVHIISKFPICDL